MYVYIYLTEKYLLRNFFEPVFIYLFILKNIYYYSNLECFFTLCVSRKNKNVSNMCVCIYKQIIPSVEFAVVVRIPFRFLFKVVKENKTII
jgi:hypothetical protein